MGCKSWGQGFFPYGIPFCFLNYLGWRACLTSESNQGLGSHLEGTQEELPGLGSITVNELESISWTFSFSCVYVCCVCVCVCTHAQESCTIERTSICNNIRTAWSNWTLIPVNILVHSRLSLSQKTLVELHGLFQLEVTQEINVFINCIMWMGNLRKKRQKELQVARDQYLNVAVLKENNLEISLWKRDKENVNQKWTSVDFSVSQSSPLLTTHSEKQNEPS